MTEKSTESEKVANSYLLQTFMDEEFSFSGVSLSLVYPPTFTRQGGRTWELPRRLKI